MSSSEFCMRRSSLSFGIFVILILSTACQANLRWLAGATPSGVSDQLNPLVAAQFKHAKQNIDVVKALDAKSQFVTGLVGGGVSIFNSNDGSLLKSYQGWLSSEVTSLETNAENTLLYIGFSTGGISVLDIKSGAVTKTFNDPGSFDSVNSIVLSPNGQYLAAGCGRKLIVWDAASGGVRYSHRELWHEFDQVVFNAASNRIYTLSYMDVGLLEIPSGKFTPLRSYASSADFAVLSADGDTMAVHLRFSNQYKIINIFNGAVTHTLTANADGETAKAFFNNDGQKLITWDHHGHIQKWRVSNGKKEYSLRTTAKAAIPLALTGAYKKMVTVDNEGTVKIFSLTKNPQPKVFLKNAFAEPRQLAVTPDGFSAVAVNSDGVFEIISSITGQITSSTTFEHGGVEMTTVESFTLSQDGSKVIAVGNIPGIHIWNIATGTQNHIDLPQENDSFKFSSLALIDQGKKLVAGTEQGDLTVWNLTTQQLEIELPRRKNSSIRSIVVSPENETLYVLTSAETIEFWSVDFASPFKMTKVIDTDYTVLDAIVLLPAEKPATLRLVSVGRQDETKIWSGHDGAFIGTIAKEERGFSTASVTPDGRHLALAGPEAELTLYDLETYQPVRKVGSKTSHFHSVSFNRAGTMLFVNSRNGVAGISIEWHNGQNVAECANVAEPAVWNPLSKACTSACPAGLYAAMDLKTCVTYCPSGTVANTAKGTCEKSCPIGFVANTANSTCIEGCPDNYWMLEGKCVPFCPSGMVADSQAGTCVEQCPSDLVLDITRSICYKGCLSGLYYDPASNRCVENCPAGSYQFPYGGRCGKECWDRPVGEDGECTAETCDFITEDSFYEPTDERSQTYGIYIGGAFAGGFVLYAIVAFSTAFLVNSSKFSLGRGMPFMTIVLIILPVFDIVTKLVYFATAKFDTPWVRYAALGVIALSSLIRIRSDVSRGHGIIWTPVRAGLREARNRPPFKASESENLESGSLVGTTTATGYFLTNTISALVTFLSYVFLAALGLILLAIAFILQWFLSWGRSDLVFSRRNGIDNSHRDFSPRGLRLAEEASKLLWRHFLLLFAAPLAFVFANSAMTPNFSEKLYWLTVIPTMLSFALTYYPYLCSLIVLKCKCWNKELRSFPHPNVFSFGDFCSFLKQSREIDFEGAKKFVEETH